MGSVTTDFCDDCKSSVYLDHEMTEVYPIKNDIDELLEDDRLEPLNGAFYFNAHPHYVRRDSMPDLGRLLAGANAGCRFCRCLRQEIFKKYKSDCLRQFRYPELSFEIDLTFAYAWIVDWGQTGRIPSLDQLRVHIDHPTWSTIVIFDVYNGLDSIIPGLKFSRAAINPDRLSKDNIQRIQQWADRGYTSLRGENARSYLPKRLLDVGPRRVTPASDSSETTREDDFASMVSENTQCDPILIETDNLLSSISAANEETRYVALSYCWGLDAPPLKTERSSLEKRYHGIPINTMPPCFQDAIEVVRVLGMRYLWIDALCIIQDDTLDWQVESGSMYDIFGNAYITIGVASTSSCQEWFLKNLPERFDVPFYSTVDQRVLSGAYSIQGSPKNESSEEYHNEPLQSLDWDLLDCNWNQRGWVWQEQNISPKLLIWGKSMFHLRGDQVESEDGTVMESKHFGSAFFTGMTEQDLKKRWYETLVSSFSERKLSVHQDRLPAISGPAKRVLDILHVPYKAGHWYSKENFCWSLLWKVCSHHPEFDELFQHLTLEKRYTAPSWSWASRTQHVQWEFPLFPEVIDESVDIAEIIECQVSSNSLDSTGTVREGKLVVTGKLKPIPVPLSSGSCDDFTCWEVSFPGVSRVWCNLDWVHKPPIIGISLKSPDYKLQMLPLMDSYKRNLIEGLLLFPLADKFLRVGLFEANLGCDYVAGQHFFTTAPDQEIIIV